MTFVCLNGSINHTIFTLYMQINDKLLCACAICASAFSFCCVKCAYMEVYTPVRLLPVDYFKEQNLHCSLPQYYSTDQRP